MKRHAILGATLLGTAVVAYQSSVNLQATTPGTPQNGHLNISGTAKAGAVVGYSSLPDGIAYGGDFRSVSTSGRGVLGNASATSGVTYGGLFQSFSTSGRGVAGIAAATSGFSVGGFFTSASTDGKGVQGSATASSGVTYGVFGSSSSPNGYGVWSQGRMHATGVISGNGSGLTAVNADLLDGLNSTAFLQSIPNPLVLSGSQAAATIISGSNTSTTNFSSGVMGQSLGTSGTLYGIYGQNASSAGAGVYGEATSLTGNAYGGIFTSPSTSGRGLLGQATATTGLAIGGRFTTLSIDGRGVWATANAATGPTYGGVFESSSPAGTGLYGGAMAEAGPTFGVYGQVLSDEGTGVLGVSSQPVAGGKGVVGLNLSAVGGYGVYGEAEGFGGFAVYAKGKFGASGTKAFRIDDPRDPENRYLLHYSSESPEPQNFYNGIVKTNAQGEAWVELPSYFEDINRDFRYTLTVIEDSDSDQFVQAKVAKKITRNRFKIRTSAPNVEVSWEVKALRNDLWIRKYGAPVEVEKPAREKGTYQHPELYGLGPERGMNYDPRMAREPIKPTPDQMRR